MPSYDYMCDACGYEFEAIQKITEKPLEGCPKCKKKSVRRLLCPSPFILKGQGWYATDYARKETESGSANESGIGKGEKASGESKEEKKEVKEPKALPSGSPPEA